MTEFNTLFEEFGRIKAGVIGDIMLDTYWWGHVERISPEAPVPVVALDKKEYRIGGAGNVALNLASLGANVSILSLVGADDNADTLKNLLGENDISTGHLLQRPSRITDPTTGNINRKRHVMPL